MEKDLIFNLKVQEELFIQEVEMVKAALRPMLREYIISEECMDLELKQLVV